MRNRDNTRWIALTKEGALRRAKDGSVAIATVEKPATMLSEAQIEKLADDFRYTGHRGQPKRVEFIRVV